MNNFDDILRLSDEICLKFIYERFNLKKYRGIQLFQHNRYDDKKFYGIIKCIKDIFLKTNKEFIEIPKGDEYNGKNKGFFVCDYPDYNSIVSLIKECGYKGTPNTLKKNYFPDWEKAGIIERKNDSKKTFFKLNRRFMENSIEIWKQNEEFKNFVGKLVEPYLEPLFSILKEYEYIDFNEFLLFFTFINDVHKINLFSDSDDSTSNLNNIKKLIESWRKLNKVKRDSCIEYLKNFMDPNIYKKQSKDQKKDWGNFRNESLEIMDKLKFAKILKIDINNCIKLNFVNSSTSIKFKRDTSIYEEYHKKNNTKPTRGYQMDHIIKFSFATTVELLPYIDNPLNIIYIDGKSHAIKTSYGSNHMKLSYKNNKVILSHTNSNIEDIILEINNNILINENNISDYIDYNKNLLSKF